MLGFMNKLFYNNLEILVHPKSYVHALVKFKNGLTKILIHDTNMTIPIFNSLYNNQTKEIKSKDLDFSIINNLNFKKIDSNKFPVVKILEKLPHKDTLFETVVVSANDSLVKMFLEHKITNNSNNQQSINTFSYILCRPFHLCHLGIDLLGMLNNLDQHVN